jgi:transposase-like protein
MNFTDEQALAYFEASRWPNGPACVHCGSVSVYRLQGKSTRFGLLECRDCKKQFSVMVGTVMEDSHLPLSTWFKAFHLMASSKKGISALQLQRNLGLGSYRTAWHLAHRIRLAMKTDRSNNKLDGVVQVDETFVGASRVNHKFADPNHPRKRGYGTTKMPVMVLVETNGDAHSAPMNSFKSKDIKEIMEGVVSPSATIVTDEMPSYRKATADFSGGHQHVNHRSGQYTNAEGYTTNTAESFFSLLKRGHYGTFHHLSKKHMHRYCDEFSFRWNGRKLNDAVRRDLAIAGIEGKRLMFYQPTTTA